MMNPYLEILRPLNGFMAVFLVVVGSIISGFFNIQQIIIASFLVFLISGAGMTINDYFDYKIDKMNKPKRPIPSGRILRKNALTYTIILLIIANLLAIFLNIYLLTFALFNSLIVIIYAWKLKRILLIGNLSVSWLAASTILFGSLLSGSIAITALVLFLIGFSSTMGREIVKTIEDIKGDKKLGLKTLPIVTNKNFAALVAILFIIFAIIFTPIPYLLGMLSINYLYIMSLSVIIFGISCFIIFLSPEKSQKLMKIAMIIAIIALLFGATYKYF